MPDMNFLDWLGAIKSTEKAQMVLERSTEGRNGPNNADGRICNTGKLEF